MTNDYWEVDPWFWEELDERRKTGGNVVAVATGPNNSGKSYWCLELCRQIHFAYGLEPFTEDGIVFNSRQFWERMQGSSTEAWALWDEPNKGLSHRDWYEEMNKAVTTFIQTFRFKRKSLLLALPHVRLLDKSARAVLLFEGMMKRPGLARVHQLEPDYFGNHEFYKYFRGEVQLGMPPMSLYRPYELKKDEFHKSDFPEEAFKTPSEASIEDLRGWRKIYAQVKETPEKYRVQDPRNPQDPGRLSARKISALLDCSDNTARKVVTKIEFESHIVR